MNTITCTLLFVTVASMINLQAQDYLITFAGTGASTDVTTIKVENLTQAKQLEINGTDILHLKAVVTDIETSRYSGSDKIGLYPNPMKDHALMQFVLPEPGEAIITIHDLSGRKLAQKQDFLTMGKQTYHIHGVEQGMYFVMVNSGRFDFKGRLISSGSGNSGIRIVYENTLAIQEKQTDIKGAGAEVVMQYNTGDILKMTGVSGNYSTVVTDVPVAGKTLTFNFIACTDGEGNNYPVLQIITAKGETDYSDQGSDKGVQTWMAENLKTTKFSDGTPIPLVTDGAAWAALSGAGYCWYNNDAAAYKVPYGALYNWYAVMDARKVCPSGWHIPTTDEWTMLTSYLGGLTIAGGKLKETDTPHWLSPNAGATNETGFTALPGGFRASSNPFLSIGHSGLWWSSTENNPFDAWIRGMYYNYIYVSSNAAAKRYGVSVRCLRD